ncbi:MAG TPA: hypothetical protein VF169_19755 [Albitalea sp.]|uniref:hypothetical protein n=1 Tax=Piscinibacter sp. TaxID=1903157 RepID=UPI002ED3B8CA
MRRWNGWVWTCAAVAMLAGCGGGGDDTGNSGFIPPNDDFNVAQAWHNLLTTNRGWTLTGSGTDGRIYDITVGTAVGPTTVFPVTGANTARSDVTLTTATTGFPTASALQQIHFDAATDRIVGIRTSVNQAAATCDLATSTSALPTTVKVGTSGAQATLTELNGCAGSSAAVGTITITWSLEFEAGTTYFCSNTTERNPGGAVLSAEGDCLQMSPDGTLGARARVTVEQNGVRVVAHTP